MEWLWLLIVIIGLSIVDKYISKAENNKRFFNSICTKDTTVSVDIQPEEMVEQIDYVPDNPTLMFISANAKSEYLQSKEWKELKTMKLLLADNKCESCGSTHNLELHHIDYTNLTQENFEDVAIVCRDCHQAIHNKLGLDRKTLYPISQYKEHKVASTLTQV